MRGTAVDRRQREFRPSQGRWTVWQTMEPALVGLGFDDVPAALMSARSSYEWKDQVLASLVQLGRCDEEARVAVIVCLLPGLMAAARRYGGCLGVEEAMGELVAALWERLGTYPIERRPERVAANLLWEATRRLLVAVRAEQRWRDATVAVENVEVLEPAMDDVDPVADAVAAGAVSDLDGTLIRATRLDGVELATAAQLLGLTYEAAKKRRRRAEAALAARWMAEAA